MENQADEFVQMIAKAEKACENDPAMHDAAAMVYVGDVYALRTLAEQPEPPQPVEAAPAPGRLSMVWPFIR